MLPTTCVLYGQRGEQQDDATHPLLLNTLKVNLARCMTRHFPPMFVNAGLMLTIFYFRCGCMCVTSLHSVAFFFKKKNHIKETFGNCQTQLSGLARSAALLDVLRAKF